MLPPFAPPAETSSPPLPASQCPFSNKKASCTSGLCQAAKPDEHFLDTFEPFEESGDKEFTSPFAREPMPILQQEAQTSRYQDTVNVKSKTRSSPNNEKEDVHSLLKRISLCLVGWYVGMACSGCTRGTTQDNSILNIMLIWGPLRKKGPCAM